MNKSLFIIVMACISLIVPKQDMFDVDEIKMHNLFNLIL